MKPLIKYLALLVCATLTTAFGEKINGQDLCGSGKKLYLEKCSQCHGENGDGKGVGSEFFKPLPRDFTSGAFKLRTTESGELPTDSDIKRSIRNGMPFSGMPAWPRFSEIEINGLVCFVKTFSSDFSDTTVHPKNIEIPKAPEFSEISADKGRKLYDENKCMDCHGKFGRGDGESGPTLKDDWGNSIRPADLTRRWTFRGGPKREDIYRTFMTGLNGTPMPSFLNSVKEEDRWPLVDYVYSLSKADEPGYGTMVGVEYSKTILDTQQFHQKLKESKSVLFPVVGQVIEGTRSFYPAINSVEVRGVYDSIKIILKVSWHDMSPQRVGTNGPTKSKADTLGKEKLISDAMAVQFPSKNPEGVAKPYFLFGDKKNPIELLFTDLAKGEVQSYLGKGRTSLVPTEQSIKSEIEYKDGEWTVYIIRPLKSQIGMEFKGGDFIPVAFFVWDGLSGEVGEAGGITSWYTLYLKPVSNGNPFYPAAARAIGSLVFLMGTVILTKKIISRKKNRLS